jgi:hypothetical protein
MFRRIFLQFVIPLVAMALACMAAQCMISARTSCLKRDAEVVFRSARTDVPAPSKEADATPRLFLYNEPYGES